MTPILVQPFGTLWSPTTKPPTYVFEEHPYSERVPLSIPAGAAFLATLEPVDAAARCAPHCEKDTKRLTRMEQNSKIQNFVVTFGKSKNGPINRIHLANDRGVHAHQ